MLRDDAAVSVIVLCINEEHPDDARVTAEFLATFMAGMTKHQALDSKVEWRIELDGRVLASHASDG